MVKFQHNGGVVDIDLPRPRFDMFGRLRSSTPHQIFNGIQLFNDLPVLFNKLTVNGATSQFQSGSSCSDLIVTTASGSRAVMQTRENFIYRAGQSLHMQMSFVMGPGKPGLIQRVGYFNNKDGIFLQLNGTSLAIVLRSSVPGQPTETVVQQQDWNIDALDGLGSSNVKLDITRKQLLSIGLQWFGVGLVVASFDFGLRQGLHHFHEFVNTNSGFGAPYMRAGSLPIRAEIENITATISQSKLRFICGTVYRDGGNDDVRLHTTIDTGIIPVLIPMTLTTVLAFRINPIYIDSTMLQLKTITLAIDSNQGRTIRWVLLMNPVLAAPLVWNDISSNHITQKSVSNVAVISDGTVTDAGYVTNETGYHSEKIDVNDSLKLGASIDGIPDIFVLACQTTQATANLHASIALIEYY